MIGDVIVRSAQSFEKRPKACYVPCTSGKLCSEDFGRMFFFFTVQYFEAWGGANKSESTTSSHPSGAVERIIIINEIVSRQCCY